jgi:hypothetical protein
MNDTLINREEVRTYVKADGYGKNALAAVTSCNQRIGG